MQGRRGNIGSFPETLDFDHGSTSSDAAIHQQICWNNLRNDTEDWLPDFMLPPNDTNISHLNSVGHEGHNLGKWSSGEPSSSNSRRELHCAETEIEHGGSSSLSAPPRADSGLGDQSEPINFLSMENTNFNFHSNEIADGPMLLRSPHSDCVTQHIDAHATLPAHDGDDCQLMECPTSYKSGESLDEIIPSASSSSDPFGSHFINGRHLVEENDGRPDCCLQGMSCKRKAVDGFVGQSSVDGSSTFQHAESSAWHADSAQDNSGSSLSMSTTSDSIGPADQVVMRPGIVAGGVSTDSPPFISVPGNAQRNVRLRVNPSHQRDSDPPNLLSRGSNSGRIEISSSSPSPNLPPVNHSSQLGSAQSEDSTSSQNQSFVVRVPPLPRIGHSFRWNDGASTSSPRNPSGPVMSGGRNSTLREESNPRNIPENPMFIPMTELRNISQNSTNWNLTGGNVSFPGNVASTSRSGSCIGIISSPASDQVHDNLLSRNQWRMSESVHRSMLQSSTNSESGGQSSNRPLFRSGPSASSQEMGSSSTFGHRGSHPSYTRSGLLLDRRGDGIPEFPYSSRNLSSGREGRSRLVSEIRNALDIARRGERLRFEDHFMIFDHPAFLRAADAHDRHRDMRLDIDLMSYEELLALEERIGNVSTGLSEETISNRLKQHKHSPTLLEGVTDIEPCCICREDYSEGDELGTLDCGHEFHTACIKQWLTHKNLCPICKTAALKIL